MAFESERYHIVRNQSQQLEVVPNQSTEISQKLPAIHLDLQTQRKPNYGQVHDARFEVINRDPAIYSRTKNYAVVNFDKLPCRDTSVSLIRRDIGQNFYEVKDSLIKYKVTGIDDWSRITARKSLEQETTVPYYNPVRAQKQLLKLKRNNSNIVAFSQLSGRSYSVNSYLSAA